jgi:hypothetical protein
MSDILINWIFTLIWALIWFSWTFFIYYLWEKSKEKNRIIYYYHVLAQPSVILIPAEYAEIWVLLYSKSKNRKFLEETFNKKDTRSELEKYI